MTGKFIVCEIKEHNPIDNADFIVSSSIFGEIVIIRKDSYPIGTKGLLFDTETQLSEIVCCELNLNRDKKLNKDREKSGYIENRRVRPIKLKGVKCSGLFLSLEELSKIDGLGDIINIKIGTEGNEFNNIPICQKYITQKTKQGRQNKQGKARVNLCPTFKEHIDTDQLMRNLHTIQCGDLVTVTEKLHGTSMRCSHLPILRQKSVFERLLNKIGIKTPDTQYKFIVGSRRVVKSINESQVKRNAEWNTLRASARKSHLNKFLGYNLKDENYTLYREIFPEDNDDMNFLSLDRINLYFEGFKDYYLNKTSGYYESDIWTKAAKENFEGKLRKGETIYCEIVGYTPEGSPIMGSHSNEKLKKFMDKGEYKDFIDRYGDVTEFSYGCNRDINQNILEDSRQNFYDVYVYRITMTNEDGESIDYSWDQIKTRCEQLGVKHVPEIGKWIVSEWSKDGLTFFGIDYGEELEEAFQRLTDEDSKHFRQHIKEGIVVRVDNGQSIPLFFKNKQFLFKVLEGIIKDNDVVDLEEMQS